MSGGTEVQTRCLASEKTELDIFSEQERGRADGIRETDGDTDGKVLKEEQSAGLWAKTKSSKMGLIGIT